jgi:hypothetical protein
MSEARLFFPNRMMVASATCTMIALALLLFAPMSFLSRSGQPLIWGFLMFAIVLASMLALNGLTTLAKPKPMLSYGPDGIDTKNWPLIGWDELDVAEERGRGNQRRLILKLRDRDAYMQKLPTIRRMLANTNGILAASTPAVPWIAFDGEIQSVAQDINNYAARMNAQR